MNNTTRGREVSSPLIWYRRSARHFVTQPVQSQKTYMYLYYFDPLKPNFYIHVVKLGFTGVYIIFLISAQNIDCGYSLEPPRRGGSNEYPQSMFWTEIRKKYQNFLSENIHFWVIKFSVCLNRHVFVMHIYITDTRQYTYSYIYVHVAYSLTTYDNIFSF